MNHMQRHASWSRAFGLLACVALGACDDNKTITADSRPRADIKTADLQGKDGQRPDMTRDHTAADVGCGPAGCPGTSISSAPNGITGLTVANDTLYLTSTSGDILSLPAAGGVLQTLLKNELGAAYPVVEGSELFWIKRADCGSGDLNCGVRKVALSGGTASTVKAITASWPSGLAVSPAWIAVGLFRQSLMGDGGGIAVIDRGTGQPKPPGSNYQLDSTVIAIEGDSIYYQTKGLAPRELYVVDVSKSSPLPGLVAQLSTGSPVGNIERPVAFSGSRFFWFDTEELKSVAKTGGAVTSLGTFSNNETIAADANYVYWSVKGGVMRLPVGGGTSSMFAASVGAGVSPQFLVIAGGYIYWYEGNLIARLPL